MAHSATLITDEVIATLKTFKGLTNIYFFSRSQKMDETLKALTTAATIFISLTLIAGIHGMNFDNMPELKHQNGY
jgi:magnesium transporter